MPSQDNIAGYSTMIPVRSERIPFKVHISVQDMNWNCIYLQRYMISHSSVLEDVVQRKPWMDVQKWSKLYLHLCICSKCSCCLLSPDLVLFDVFIFKKSVFFEQVKLKVQFIYLTACIYSQNLSIHHDASWYRIEPNRWHDNRNRTVRSV